MTRTSTAAVSLATLLAFAAPAGAQTVSTEASSASPQRFAWELRFGPYSPDVDATLGSTDCGGGPYAATFGSDGRFYFETEFDWQIFRFYVGSFGLGAAVGLFNATARSFVQGTNCQRSADETSLWALPLSLLLSLRFDYLANTFGVPLVPFFKFGVTYALWWGTDANGITRAEDGSQGYGGTAGLRLGGGLMLQLDWMEPRAARTFDNEYGVNHSYLFFEWYWAWLDGFGDERRMNLGDSTWVAGLALEF